MAPISQRRGRCALIARKVLRHPAAVLGSAALLYFLACVLGSKTIWYGHFLWQTPSLLIGALGGPAVVGIAGYIAFLAGSAAPSKNYWKNVKRSAFRHG